MSILSFRHKPISIFMHFAPLLQQQQQQQQVYEKQTQEEEAQEDAPQLWQVRDGPHPLSTHAQFHWFFDFYCHALHCFLSLSGAPEDK